MLKYNFKTGLRPMAWTTLGMTAFFLFLFAYLTVWVIHNAKIVQPYEKIEWVCHDVCEISTIVMLVFSMICSCLAFKGVQDKAPRIVMLMLPASSLEKFLSRLVYLTCFILAGTLIAFVVADVIYMSYLFFAGYPVASSSAFAIRHVAETMTYKTMPFFAIAIGLILAADAFCLFCGVFFNKYQLPVTAMLFFVSFMSVALTLGLLGIRDPNTQYVAIVGTIEIIATVGFVIGAYKVFRQWQVVTHKFVNL